MNKIPEEQIVEVLSILYQAINRDDSGSDDFGRARRMIQKMQDVLAAGENDENDSR